VTETTLRGDHPQLEKRLSAIYDQLRCGMYHDGIAGPRIVVSGEIGQNVLQLQGEELHVNPQALVRAFRCTSADTSPTCSRTLLAGLDATS